MHNTTARYIFALGRERVLSAFFGSTSASGAPLAGSIAQTSIALLTVLVYVVFNLDPAVQLFFVGGTLGGLGILVLLITTSVSVVLFFARNRRGETAWHTLIAPVLAVLGVGGSLAGLDPRHHLWFLAVKPELQGHGLGALLLAQHDRVLDDDGVAGYLDASSPRSRQLYLRHGYRDVREPFVLPDGGPPSFPHVAGTWRRRMNQLAS